MSRASDSVQAESEASLQASGSAEVAVLLQVDSDCVMLLRQLQLNALGDPGCGPQVHIR